MRRYLMAAAIPLAGCVGGSPTEALEECRVTITLSWDSAQVADVHAGERDRSETIHLGQKVEVPECARAVLGGGVR
jgi:hypothetical protein